MTEKIDGKNGYAFIDECDYCIIIVYGESRRDMLLKHFKNNTNEFGIKYNYINMRP